MDETLFFTTFSVEVDGFNTSAVAIYPVTEKLDIFAKAGFYSWDASFSVTGFGSTSDTGTDLSYGVGGAINFTDNFGLVLEYQVFNLDGDDVTNISLGARFYF